MNEASQVTISLHEITGIEIQAIYKGELSKGLHNFTIDGTSLAPGVYTYRILGANFSEAAKAVLIK
jgi:flagellar hook assembly protein FlgD